LKTLRRLTAVLTVSQIPNEWRFEENKELATISRNKMQRIEQDRSNQKSEVQAGRGVR
jgi:hypothetical protein